VRLDLIEFTNAPGLKRATIADLHGRLYEGVRQARTLIVTPDYVMDFFQASSTEPHVFTWLTHVDGQRVAGSLTASTPVKLPAEPPWSYLRDPRGAGSTNSFWECFTDGKKRLRLNVLTDATAEISDCGFPRDDSRSSETIPMRMVSRRGTNAWFLAIYEMVGHKNQTVRLAVQQSRVGQFEISMQAGRKTVRYQIGQLGK